MPLSHRHRAFCRAVAAGDGHRDAYLAIYPKSSREAAAVSAARLMRNPDVVEEIRRLRSLADERAAMEYIEKRLMLAGIARDDEENAFARLAAIKMDNQMAGHDAPAQVEHTVTLQALLGAGRSDLDSHPAQSERSEGREAPRDLTWGDARILDWREDGE